VLGANSVRPGAFTAPLSGVASAFASGALVIATFTGVRPTGIATAVATGTPTLQRGAVTLAPTGITSAEDTGDLNVRLRLALTGIVTGAAFGTAGLGQPIGPTGIVSAEALGSHRMTLALAITGMATGFVSDIQHVHFGNQNILASGITTTSALGTGQSIRR